MADREKTSGPVIDALLAMAAELVATSVELTADARTVVERSRCLRSPVAGRAATHEANSRLRDRVPSRSIVARGCLTVFRSPPW
jgi:hypothetical protein